MLQELLCKHSLWLIETSECLYEEHPLKPKILISQFICIFLLRIGNSNEIIH